MTFRSILSRCGQRRSWELLENIYNHFGCYYFGAVAVAGSWELGAARKLYLLQGCGEQEPHGQDKAAVDAFQLFRMQFSVA